MKILFGILLSMLLISCASDPEIVYVDRLVEVPVVLAKECPKLPEVTPINIMPVDNLRSNSTNQEVAKAYVKTVTICKSKLKQYREALEVPNPE